MSKVTIEGKVIKVKGGGNGYYLYIEVDENGIGESTNTDKYYKPLLVKDGDKVVSGCAQEVKKDKYKDYYYVEIFVPLGFSMPSAIGKKIKIKFECGDPSKVNVTPICVTLEEVEYEIYE